MTMRVRGRGRMKPLLMMLGLTHMTGMAVMMKQVLLVMLLRYEHNSYQYIITLFGSLFERKLS
jgi:hypothetical protein